MIYRIQNYLRAETARTRDTESIGPFLATFSRSSSNPFLNYAIPDDGAAPTGADVDALAGAYERRGLHPRLEYITACAPAVESVLLAVGFTVEWRPALMTCRNGEDIPLATPSDIELIRPETESELLATRTVQHEAYGDPQAPSAEDARRLCDSLKAGGMAVLARLQASGEPVGAGEYTAPLDGLTEIAGIAVREPFRRLGIAGAITAWLLRSAFDSGAHSPFLTGNEAEQRIYARAGFRTVSEIVHISRHS